MPGMGRGRPCTSGDEGDGKGLVCAPAKESMPLSLEVVAGGGPFTSSRPIGLAGEDVGVGSFLMTLNLSPSAGMLCDDGDKIAGEPLDIELMVPDLSREGEPSDGLRVSIAWGGDGRVRTCSLDEVWTLDNGGSCLGFLRLFGIGGWRWGFKLEDPETGMSEGSVVVEPPRDPRRGTREGERGVTGVVTADISPFDLPTMELNSEGDCACPCEDAASAQDL